MVNETISIINTLVRTRIAPSGIHGVGVFALNDIAKGTKLYADMFPQAYKIPFRDFDLLKPEIRDLIMERWPQVVNGSAFMYPDSRIQTFMNHSEDPNYNAFDDVMLKDVKQGEEITENYKDIPNWELVFTWLK